MNWTARTIAALALLCLFINAEAKKYVYGMDAVVLTADLIVVGTIQGAAAGVYSFRIEETLHGIPDNKVISVKKWKEWTCDQRAFKITPGQRLLLLLDHDGGHYSPINESTGEIRIENDTLELYHENAVVVDNMIRGYRMHLNEFREAVKALRECAAMTGIVNEFGYFPGSAKWLCDEATIAGYLKREDFTGWLFRKAEEYRVGPAQAK